MRKSVLFLVSAAVALGVSACSEKTQDNAEKTVNAAGDDVEKAADSAGNAVEKAGKAAGNAVEDAGRAIGNAADNAGAKAEQERAEAEGDIQDESVTKAKRD